MADVLVRGMDMPECCGECPAFIERSYFDGDEWHCGCFILEKEIFEDDKDVSCPLVKLPEHGDLISREQLLEEVSKYIDEQLGFLDGHTDTEEVLRMIREAPTVLEANYSTHKADDKAPSDKGKKEKRK